MSITITGTYHSTARAFGFLTPDGGGADWFIPPRMSGGAWDGDAVLAQPLETGEDGARDAARVMKITARAHESVTGVLRKHNHQCWLEPDDKKLPPLILVTGRLHNAHSGDKAAVAVRSYASGRGQTPCGELTQIFGPSGELSAIVASILYNYHIEPEFPEEVMAQALAVPEEAEKREMAGRLDLRGETVITIDGASTRDFDDAVSLTRDEAGRWRLGVHIADVSHYVPHKSPLDREAYERGTSVYYADRVVPMLPIALSNGICSLNPGVDRLTLSCFMTLDRSGTIVEHTIVKSVIRSAERMTYEDCNLLLAGGDGKLEARYAHILPMLRDMAALASTLSKRRRGRGALFLESNEIFITCDEEGRPSGMGLRQPGQSEALIEEFMLAANETVAKHLADAAFPCVYRVHEKPASEKLDALRAMLAPLGYVVGEGDGFALQKVLDEAADKPEAPMINTMLLRAQMRARYSAENSGHFGLAAPFYCHFTSPIRRYPDLMVHRVLTVLLSQGTNPKLPKAVEYAAEQSSRREQDAANAEREIEKCYAAQYMTAHIGEKFHGVVSGVTRFGLFVTLSNGAEGMLPTESLPRDEYQYEENAMTLAGRNNAYRFGMPLEVVIDGAEPALGEITLRLEGVPVGASAPVRRRQAEEAFFPPKRRKGGPPTRKGPGNRRGRPGPRGKRRRR